MTPEQTSRLEKVIRPIVEGQIRGFVKEHPSILKGVDWYKPRKDKAATLINSLSKRIVRDLVSGMTSARLVDALVEPPTAARQISIVAQRPAAERPILVLCLGWASRFFHGKQ